ncbi:MAG TPA: cytochrome c biogenesis protein CcdA [Candidatus Paceibacterota bacterium]|nr:cytochrome c biogenesis protein CcdA [Candidatus Paceibacterota bacterium]
MSLGLIIPAFVAGLLTFLAPCTLPLVPGYLGFIGGVSQKDLNDPQRLERLRPKILLNGLFYTFGFSAVFVIFGSLFGLTGAALGEYRPWLTKLGGAFVVFFGLFMMDFFTLPGFRLLQIERRLRFRGASLHPGNPLSSFVFGAAFAFGWTPCVGPILGSVLTLAASSATAAQGAFLLLVFSLGLAAPFLVLAYFISHTARWLAHVFPYIRFVSFVGGAFLVFLGVLLLTDQMGVWNAFFFRAFHGIDYDLLMDHL